MKRFTIACLSLLTTLALAGCSQQQGGQASYIGSDAAQTVALEAAGVSKSNASVTSTELGQRNRAGLLHRPFHSRRPRVRI